MLGRRAHVISRQIWRESRAGADAGAGAEERSGAWERMMGGCRLLDVNMRDPNDPRVMLFEAADLEVLSGQICLVLGTASPPQSCRTYYQRWLGAEVAPGHACFVPVPASPHDFASITDKNCFVMIASRLSTVLPGSCPGNSNDRTYHIPLVTIHQHLQVSFGSRLGRLFGPICMILLSILVAVTLVLQS